MYYQHGSSFYELMAKGKFVEVSLDDTETGIMIIKCPPVWETVRYQGVEISQNTFYNKYREAQKKLSDHLEVSKELDEERRLEMREDRYDHSNLNEY